jgi:hypothetical protein
MPPARLLERESAAPAVRGKDTVNGQSPLWDPHSLQEPVSALGVASVSVMKAVRMENYIQLRILITASPVSGKCHPLLEHQDMRVMDVQVGAHD